MENNLVEQPGNGMKNARNVFVGILVGGLAGAVTMLLFAPQSGKKTRTQIQQKGIELRDQTTKTIKKTLAQVRSKTNQITGDVMEKAGELKQIGQDKLVEQLDRMSVALDSGKSAVKAG